jgi:hypothetical protein
VNYLQNKKHSTSSSSSSSSSSLSFYTISVGNSEHDVTPNIVAKADTVEFCKMLPGPIITPPSPSFRLPASSSLVSYETMRKINWEKIKVENLSGTIWDINEKEHATNSKQDKLQILNDLNLKGLFAVSKTKCLKSNIDYSLKTKNKNFILSEKKVYNLGKYIF